MDKLSTLTTSSETGGEHDISLGDMQAKKDEVSEMCAADCNNDGLAASEKRSRIAKNRI